MALPPMRRLPRLTTAKRGSREEIGYATQSTGCGGIRRAAFYWWGGSGSFGASVLHHQDRLKLTPAQMTQLENILHETKAKTRAVRDSYQPQMLKIKQDHIERVKSILTAEQIPAYEKLVAEREQRSREQEEHDRKNEHQYATH